MPETTQAAEVAISTNLDPYNQGVAAFGAGVDRLACPYPGPFSPPRSDADFAPARLDGAFWLDGWEAAHGASASA